MYTSDLFYIFKNYQKLRTLFKKYFLSLIRKHNLAKYSLLKTHLTLEGKMNYLKMYLNANKTDLIEEASSLYLWN